uniref:PX domain-containing protein n=1 Tax=Plectus sambesii TaxID=2011161 RepID=A0A914VZA4_9BILA
MIHVTIPDTKSLVEADGTRKYDAFNIHLNGAFHASIRYSHLRRLHDALKQEFNGRLLTPDFPGKKLKKHLDAKALAERRLALMRYLQAVVQNSFTSRHRITEKFFLDAQVESFRPSSSNISVDVYMCDGTKQTVRCSVENPTSVVLELFCRAVGIAPENIMFFGLFLAKNNAQGKGVLVERWLKNYESPYISLQLANLKAMDGVFHKLIVRKIIWDTKIEDDLLADPGAVNLLFTQAVADITNGNFVVPADTLQRLRSLQLAHSWKDYLRLCHLQNSYGYEVLEPCVADYPSPDNRCDLRVGRRQIVLSYTDPKTGEPVESAFRATRIRVWKIVNQVRKSF